MASFFCTLLFIEPFEPFFGNLYILPLGLGCPLFEAVQDVDDVCNLLQVKHAIPCTLVLIAQFIDSRTNRPHGLAVRRHLPKLHLIQRITQVALNRCRKVS